MNKIIVNSRNIKESNDIKIREKEVEVITEIQQPTIDALINLCTAPQAKENSMAKLRFYAYAYVQHILKLARIYTYYQYLRF